MCSISAFFCYKVIIWVSVSYTYTTTAVVHLTVITSYHHYADGSYTHDRIQIMFFRRKLGIVFQIRQGVTNGINLIPHFDKTLSCHGVSEFNVDAVATLQRLFFRISYGWGHLIRLGQSLGGHPRSSFSDLGKLTWVQKGRWDFCRGEINSPTPCCYFPIFYVDCQVFFFFLKCLNNPSSFKLIFIFHRPTTCFLWITNFIIIWRIRIWHFQIAKYRIRTNLGISSFYLWIKINTIFTSMT